MPSQAQAGFTTKWFSVGDRNAAWFDISIQNNPKEYYMRHAFLLLFALILTVGVARAESDLVVYNILNLSEAAWNGSQVDWSISRDSKHANVTPGPIIARKGTTLYDNHWWGYKSENMWLINWPQTKNMGQDYYEFTVSAANTSTHRLNLSSISVGVAREAYDDFIGGAIKGAQTYQLYSSIDGYAEGSYIAQLTLPAPFEDPNNQRIDQGVLEATLGPQYSNIPTVTFRVYGFGDSTMDPNEIRGGGGLANFAESFEHRISEIEPFVPYTVDGTGSNVIVRGTVSSGSTPASRTVSTDKQGSGIISPTSQTVAQGSTTWFDITPGSGNAIVSAEGCGGTLLRDPSSNSGTYYTAAVIENCTVAVVFGQIRSVTATASPGGQVSPIGTFNVAKDFPATFSVVPNVGMLREEQVGGTCPNGSWSGDTYETGSISFDCSVHFNFIQDQDTHTVTSSAGPNGTVVPLGEHQVVHGSTSSYNVTPADGYERGAVGGNCPPGANGGWSGNTYTTGVISNACDISFSFTQTQYTVSAQVIGEGGTVTPDSQQVVQGSTASFTVTPVSGYERGSVGGDCPTTPWNGDTYTTGPISSECSVSFRFVPIPRLVTATAGPNGSVSPDSQEIPHGTAGQFSVIPANGYTHGSVGGSCPKGGFTGDIYTTGLVVADCSLDFSFVAIWHSVSASAGPGGSIDPESRFVLRGDSAAFNVSIEDGYRFDGVDGECLSGNIEDGVYSTGAITKDCSLTLNFIRPAGYYIKGEIAGVGGIVDPEKVWVEEGGRVELNVIPAKGYETRSQDDGGCGGTFDGSKYTIEAVNAECDIQFWFSPLENTVGIVVAEGGSVEPSSREVFTGSRAEFEVTPEEGYVLGMVAGTCPSGYLKNDTTYLTGIISEDCDVEFAFSQNRYPVSQTHDADRGRVTPPAREVGHGATATFEIEVFDGFSLGEVRGTCPKGVVFPPAEDDELQLYYSTGTVTEPCNIEFRFTDMEHFVSATATTGGSVTVSQQQVGHGASASFTVLPSEGHHHGKVTGSCPLGFYDGNIYTSGQIYEDCSLEFHFSQTTYRAEASAGDGGTVSPEVRIVGHGSKASFSVTPDEGYLPGRIRGTCPEGVFSGSTYVTGSLQEDCAVEFLFSQEELNVESSAGDGGDVFPESLRVGAGSKATFTVVPEDGFRHAQTSGTCPSGHFEGNTYTTGAIAKDCDIGFSFALLTETHLVTVSSSEGGTISPDRLSVGHGSRASFSVFPAEDFIMSQVEGTCPGGKLNGSNYTTGLISDDCHVHVSFSPSNLAVDVAATTEDGGSVSPESQRVAIGSRASFSVIPDSGFLYGRVEGDCPDGYFDGSTFVTGIIDETCEVIFEFIDQFITVHAEAGDNGSVQPESLDVGIGSKATFFVTPETGYKVSEDIETTCPEGVFSENRYVTGEISGDDDNCRTSFAFEEKIHTVDLRIEGQGGAILFDGEEISTEDVHHNTIRDYTISPDIGYSILSVEGCNGTLSGNEYKTGKIVEDCEIVAKFRNNVFDIITEAVNGAAFGGGSYAYGTSVLIRAEPSSGHGFDRWVEDGKDDPILEREFTIEVDESRTFTAFFNPVPIPTLSFYGLVILSLMFVYVFIVKYSNRY